MDGVHRAARRDFLQAASYLVLGAATAATLNVLMPPTVYEYLADQRWSGVILMAILAFVLGAVFGGRTRSWPRTLTMLPPLPRLVFLVVGPAVDASCSRYGRGVRPRVRREFARQPSSSPRSSSPR